MKKSEEQKIWDYLDGILPESEVQAMDKLIKDDEEYSMAYREISQLRRGLQQFQLKTPSTELSGRLMEAYRRRNIQEKEVTKPGIDRRLIRALLVFLCCMPIVVLLLSIPGSEIHYQLNFEQPISSAITDHPLIWILALLNCFFIVRVIRKRYDLQNRYNI